MDIGALGERVSTQVLRDGALSEAIAPHRRSLRSVQPANGSAGVEERRRSFTRLPRENRDRLAIRSAEPHTDSPEIVR